MPLTNYALDNFVAKDISKFTEHTLKSIAPDFDQNSHWLNNCLLNSILVSPIPDEVKPGTFSIVRKGEHCLREYELGLEYLEKFLNEGRKTSDYFRALSHMEVCLSSAYHVLEYIKRITEEPFFKKGDGSLAEKLNRIYNISKHLQKHSFIPQQLHLFWFSNSGLFSAELGLKYDEVKEIVRDICEITEKISSLRCTDNKEQNS